jgi:divalent metal cation (Fe/Co/Zn/Cd) transporter
MAAAAWPRSHAEADGSGAAVGRPAHNVGDALTAVPLAAAFLLLRRPPSDRLTYGRGRSEDFAGMAVVAMILFSAIYTAYALVETALVCADSCGEIWLAFLVLRLRSCTDGDCRKAVA